MKNPTDALFTLDNMLELRDYTSTARVGRDDRVRNLELLAYVALRALDMILERAIAETSSDRRKT